MEALAWAWNAGETFLSVALGYLIFKIGNFILSLSPFGFGLGKLTTDGG